MMPEIMTQPEDAGHETTAHFSGRFAHFAIELFRLFDDENARRGMLAFQQNAVAAPEKAPPITTTS